MLFQIQRHIRVNNGDFDIDQIFLFGNFGIYGFEQCSAAQNVFAVAGTLTGQDR